VVKPDITGTKKHWREGNWNGWRTSHACDHTVVSALEVDERELNGKFQVQSQKGK
jgi:hypothetical protein